MVRHPARYRSSSFNFNALGEARKLHLADTGLASAMVVTGAPDLQADRTLLGSLMETLVFQELRRLASWHDEAHSFFHYRDKDGAEVNIVIERGVAALAGVEVKAGATVRSTDFRGLRKLLHLVVESKDKLFASNDQKNGLKMASPRYDFYSRTGSQGNGQPEFSPKLLIPGVRRSIPDIFWSCLCS